jgi:MSHA biogenesis protein MshI
MSAQVNLVQVGMRKRRDILTLAQVVLLTLIVYLGLAGMAGWAWWQTTERQKAVAALEDETKKLKAQMDELTQKAAKANPQLAAEIELLQVQVRRKDDMARLLEAKASGGKEGFSEYMQGLARQIPEGLWLTGIAINDGGGDVEIRGSLIDTAALPEYIHRLGNEPTFRGRVFSTLSMNRVTAPAGKLTGNAAAPVGLAVQQGVATPELQGKLTGKPGAFVGVAPTRNASGELANVIDFVLVPQRSAGKEAKP